MTIKRGLLWAAYVALFIAGLLTVVPIAPVFPNIALDSSWQYAMNESVARGLVFGRDVIFTYGPYASLFTRQYHPVTDSLMLGGAFLVGVAWMLMIIAQLRHSPRSFMWLWPAMLLGFVRDAPFFVLPIFYLATAARAALPDGHPDKINSGALTRASILVCSAALGLLPLIKGTFAIAVVPILLLTPAVLWRTWKSSLLTVPVAIATMLLAWKIAGQPTSALLPFFLAQRPIVSGYTEAMSLVASNREVWLTVLCIAVLAAVSWNFCGRAGFVTLVWRAGFTFILYLGIKAGFVRADGHVMMTISLIVMCVVLVTVRRPVIALVALLITCGVYWKIDLPYWTWENGSFFQRVGREGAEVLSSPTWQGRRDEYLGDSFRGHLRILREEYPLSKIDGSVDIYPTDISVLLASGLNWSPRPVTQSYSAYTPSLADIDAAHLAGAKAPDHLLFGLGAIDYRYPTIEDGPSWIPMLTRYRPSGIVNEYVLMDRAASVEPITPVARLEFRTNTPTSVPDVDGPLFVQIEMKSTLLGKLTNLAMKNARVHLEVLFTDGRSITYAMPPKMAEAGFLLSPLVQTKTDVIALYASRRAEYFEHSKIRKIRVWAPGSRWKETVVASFSQIPVSQGPQYDAMLMTLAGEGAPATQKAADEACALDTVNGLPSGEVSRIVGHSIRVEGWAVVSTKEGRAPDDISITLTGPNGKTLEASARRIYRRDVNNYFNHPKMAPVGFFAWFDADQLTGDYMLDVKLTKDGHPYTCGLRKPIKVIR